MYANVIVGIDGGPGGAQAAALGAVLAAADARITLVYVSVPFMHRESGFGLDDGDDGALSKLLERELALYGGRAAARRVKAGSVAEGLDRIAADEASDLIVVGASARHGLSRLLSGDDVESVVHRAPCAVAVAPAVYSGDRNGLARIGVAYDGSPASAVALAHAGLLAASRNAELVVRHIVEPHYYPIGLPMLAPPEGIADTALAAAREELGSPDGLELEHVYGALGEELVKFSASVALLFCGSRHGGLIRRVAAGSSSNYLARHSAAPLIVAPSADPETVERWRTHLAQTATPAAGSPRAGRRLDRQ